MIRMPLLLALCLAACDKPAPDGYRFEAPEYERQSVTIVLTKHRNLKSVKAAALKAGAQIDEGNGVAAWSVISRDRATCTIHIVDPAINYQPHWLGHEVTHCLYGRWHP